MASPGLSKSAQALNAHLRDENDLRRQRMRRDPIGKGALLKTCDCGQRFYTDDTWAVDCPNCDGSEQAQIERSYEGDGRSYNYSPFRRGGYRE